MTAKKLGYVTSHWSVIRHRRQLHSYEGVSQRLMPLWAISSQHQEAGKTSAALQYPLLSTCATHIHLLFSVSSTHVEYASPGLVKEKLHQTLVKKDKEDYPKRLQEESRLLPQGREIQLNWKKRKEDFQMLMWASAKVLEDLRGKTSQCE